MARYMMKRFWAMAATILVITTLTFVFMKVIPGSPFNEERGTNEAVQKNLEAYYHLDDPLIFQYIIYLKSIITFDFGPSIKKPSDSVNDMLERGFPVSFELGMTAIVIAVISGLVLGVIAALRRNGFLDYAAMSLAVLGISIPNFILATLLIQQFAVNLKLFPAATWTSPIHMVLPTAALAVGPMAIIARLTRSSMVEVLT
ncbi:dipeptide ABC transporter permease DppB, partial [Bacillus inaquosorum]|nr:dipeptide ABC transporter permease DppB [Bacillus inaquosorum]